MRHPSGVDMLAVATGMKVIGSVPSSPLGLQLAELSLAERIRESAIDPNPDHALISVVHSIGPTGGFSGQLEPEFGGPPGARSRHLGIKRNFQSVVSCRSRRAGRLISRKRVVSCRSGLVVLQKYEACFGPHGDS